MENLISVSTSEEEMFTPKKYKIRSGTTDSGKDYEMKVTALLALRCCSEELQHFWLAANVDGFGALDDIIMFKKSKKDEGVTYFMQLKHQDSSKNITKDMILSTQGKGNFSLKKYSDCYSTIKSTINDKTKTADIIKHLRQVNKMVFIMFTNKGVTADSQFFKKANDVSQLDNIQVEGDIFEIDHESSDVNVDFLKNLYLLSNQPHINDMNNEIQTSIKNLLQPLQLSEMELRDIAHKFVFFVGEWSNGLLNGHYPLTKMRILKKLAESLLLPYAMKLPEPEEDNSKNGETMEEVGEENREDAEDGNIWYDLTKDKDVTIIDDVDDVIQRFITDSTHSILRNTNIFNSITSINKELLRVVSNSKKMSNNDKYELLWKTGKIPLLLHVSDSQGLKHIQAILNALPGVFRVIIFNKTKAHIEYFQASKPFTSIADLNEEQQKHILQLPVKLQGRTLSSIQKLNIHNEQFYKSLKVKDIVHILCSQFNIGGELEQLPDFFVEMSLTRIILDIKVLKEAAHGIFAVKCDSCSDFRSFLARQLAFSEEQVIEWEYLNKNNFKGRIIIFKVIQNLQEIEEFCVISKKSAHFLVWHGSDNLEWIKSNNTIANLGKFEKPSTKIDKIFAKEVLVNIFQYKKPLLVSANPGMGKSVLINYFTRNVPINLWVLRVNLPKHKSHYKKNCNSQEKKCKYFKQFLKEVLNEQQICNRIVSDLVFEQFLKSKNLALLLDGFDEVPIIYQNDAKELIKFINQSGYHMCVTTRPVLKKDLESVLNTFAITLNSFTIDEQMCFLTNYFANIGNIRPSDNRLISFVTKLLEATRKNLNDIDNRFTGIPLQTKLMAQVFGNDFIKYLEDEIFKNQYFDLIYLYKHFINKIIKIAFNKVESVSEDMINQYKTCRSFYALSHLFSDEDLVELHIEDDLRTITKLLPHTMQIIQKDGIIVTDSESNVSFVHQTYAEYLVANWLSENINTSYKAIVQNLITKTFQPSFLVVRNMFDRILARNSSLHTAIINRQINTVKQIIMSDENSLRATDDGGRTILHLIAAWGLHHPDNVKQYIGSQDSDEMMIILKLIPNNKLIHSQDELLRYTPLDYAILSRSLSIADRICSIIKNPKCYINITKAEADNILHYVEDYYPFSLYVVILRRQIGTDFDLHCQNEDNSSNLHKAISNGDKQNVFSITSRNNINKPDDNGYTPLHAAAKYGHIDIMRYLLSRNAKINKPDKKGRSALHWASYQGHLDIVSLLITAGVNVSITDIYNRTALHYAVISSSNNACNIITILIKSNNIHLTRIGNVLNTVFKKAADVYSALSKNSNFINITDNHKMNALHWAAKNGQTDVITLLLTNGVDIEAKGSNNTTPLHVAAVYGRKDVVSVLLINGADIEAKARNDETPLNLAVQHGHKDVVLVLLTNGANIEAKNSSYKTPLHLAAGAGRKKLVSVLLANSADIEAKYYTNQTPLHLAALNDHKNVVSVLLSNGADIEAKDSKKETPLHLAAGAGHKDVVSVLLANGANMEAKARNDETPLNLAVQNGHNDVVLELLTNGANIEAKNSSNKTPLHLAAGGGRRNVVSVLLTNGADIEAKFYTNQTPLHLAALNDHKDVVSVLLSHGADIQAKDSKSETPLHLAARAGHKGIVNVLLANGADIEAKARNNQTPLNLALEHGHKDVVNVLLSHGAKNSSNKTQLQFAVFYGYNDD